MISDDDKYGPLIQKTKFSRVEERMLEGNIRIIDSKRFIILLIEFSQTKNHSTVSAIRLPYNSDDQKLKIIDKLKTEAVTGLTYNVSQGICHLDDNLYNECKYFLLSYIKVWSYFLLAFFKNKLS